jgi:formate hydrogenlyase subunit 4
VNGPGPLLAAVAWALLAPIALFAASPLLDGFGRRIRARLEARVGPPWLQGYIDLAKLAGKRETSAGVNPLADLAPWVALATAVAAGALLPFGGHAPLGAGGDAIAVLYLLGLSTAALVLAGAATGSPYAFLGGSREMVLLLFVEPVVAWALFVVALKAGTFRLAALTLWQAADGFSVSSALAGLGALLGLLAYMGRIPFDLGEAEQELMGGTTVEFGGRRLALVRWTLFVRWLVAAWLTAEVFLPTPMAPLPGLVAAVVKVLLLFTLAAALGVLFARLKVGHAGAWLAQIGLVLAAAIVFALIGA